MELSVLKCRKGIGNGKDTLPKLLACFRDGSSCTLITFLASASSCEILHECKTCLRARKLLYIRSETILCFAFILKHKWIWIAEVLSLGPNKVLEL